MAPSSLKSNFTVQPQQSAARSGVRPARRIWASLLVIPLLVWLAGCSYTTAKRVDWQFVQAVGGMAIGTPEKRAEGGWLLPVRCDISGLQEITVKPTTINSALLVKGFKVWRIENRINLTLRTSPFGKTSQTTAAFLGELPPGDYSVSYADPQGATHPLGSFNIPK